MPDQKVGVIILVNEGLAGAAFVDMLAMFIYDNMLDSPGTREKYTAMASQFDKKVSEIREQNERHFKELSQRQWQLSLPLKSYAGRYKSTYLGMMELSVLNDTLVVTHGNLKSVSNPFRDKETIRVELIPGEGTVVFFKIEGDKVVALKHNGIEYVRSDR